MTAADSATSMPSSLQCNTYCRQLTDSIRASFIHSTVADSKQCKPDEAMMNTFCSKFDQMGVSSKQKMKTGHN